MTQISTHTYTAVLDDDTDLSISGGSITLDAGSIPHVDGRLVLAVEDAALLDDLDPRDGRRLTITCERTSNEITRTRTFDLGIRDVKPNRADGTVEVILASDEGLLTDYAQLVDDTTPYDLAGSLRDIVNYVLDKALGVELEQFPALDADVTPYWKVTNLLRNPAVSGGSIANWSAGGGCSVAYVAEASTGSVRVSTTGASGAVFAVDITKYNLNARAGETYTFELAARNEGVSGGNMQAVLRFLDANNGPIVDVPGPLQPSTTSFERLGVTARAPANAVKVAPFWRFQDSASGRVFRVDAGILHTEWWPVPTFTGSDADTDAYLYTYEGGANDSPSVRTPVTERNPDAFLWQAGTSAMDFLEPLLKTVGFRLVCDESRRWTLRNDEYRAEGSQTWRHGVNITAADESLSRSDETWFDGAVYVYEWTDRDSIVHTRTDAYSLTPTPAKVLRHKLNVPYPGPGRAQRMVERAQGKGRTIAVSGIPTWGERTDQELSITLDGTPIQTGIASRVQFDLDADEVTISSRTTDTPAGAIDLLQGTTNALTGTINNL